MSIKADQHGFEVQAGRPFSSQNITIGVASVASSAFKTLSPQGNYTDLGVPTDLNENNTLHVRVVSNTNCWIAFGAAPVAVAQTTPSIYLPAATPEYFWVSPGEKIAVIWDTAAGFLNIAELDN